MPTFEDPGDLQPSDWPGAPPAVLGYFNRALRRVRTFLRARFGLSANIDCDVQTLRCTHGTELVLKSRLTSVRGLTVLSAAGQVVENARLIANGGQPRLTVYFASGSGSADVTVVLWPEGCATGASTSYYPALRTSLFTATGDLIYASAPNTPARLAAGALNTVLTSGGPGVAPSWAAASAGSSVPSGAAWWVKPTSPDAFDDEFDSGSSLNVAWTQYGTVSGSAVDPYAAFNTATTSRQSVNTYRPGWWVTQPTYNADTCDIWKAVTLNTNDLFYMRVFVNVPPGGVSSAGNCSIGMYLTDATETNYMGVATNRGGTDVVEYSSFGGSVGVPTSISLTTTGITDLAIHKVGTRYYLWCSLNGQSWRQVSTGTHATAFTRFKVLTRNSGAPATNWGNPIMGLDYVRRVPNSATALSWPT